MAVRIGQSAKERLCITHAEILSIQSVYYEPNWRQQLRSDGIELLFARSMILNAARSAGIAALDTVYSDVNNEEGFIEEVTLIRKLGFDGKSVINPRQIGPLHHTFIPSEKDLKKAYAIMDAIAEANARGSGVASLNGKMIDKPVVIRAQRLIALAEADNTVEEEE